MAKPLSLPRIAAILAARQRRRRLWAKAKAVKQERASWARQSRIGVTHRFRNDWNLCFKLNRLTQTYHSSFSPVACSLAITFFQGTHPNLHAYFLKTRCQGLDVCMLFCQVGLQLSDRGFLLLGFAFVPPLA